MSEILKALGLDRAAVARLTGSPMASNAVLYHSEDESKNYLYGPDQAKIRTRLKEHESWVVAMFLVDGLKPKTIAQLLGVSEESVRRRLRESDLFHSKGKAGRPYRREK